MNPTALAVPLRGLVVYPGMVRSLPVGRPASVATIEEHLRTSEPIVLVPQRDPDEEDPIGAPAASVGTVAQILGSTHLPDGTLRVLVQGLQRVRVRGAMAAQGDHLVCTVQPMPTAKDDPIKVGALAKQVARMFAEYVHANGIPPQDQELLSASADDPDRVADQVAGHLAIDLPERIALLEEPSTHRRLQLVVDHLAIALAGQKLQAEIAGKVQAAMDTSQREYQLREQLKAIREELGESHEADADRFEARIREADLPDDARREALREVERLRRMPSDSAEYTVARTWLETVCDVPWNEATTDATDLFAAEGVLDEDHHGLEKVKERILEYLAVRQLHPESKGPILCFVGPPGVGKTSLGRSIARALGRKFGRIALGGIKDETEVRGHRRTYLGALPGRILRALVRAGSRNPVLVLDEIDKVGNDFRGDPASALLEVLDPEQNHAFVDHYLDLPVDLSQVLFIATANLRDPIPPALVDRLEVIEIPGYTEEDKVRITRKFLLPKLAEAHGLDGGALKLTEGALVAIIRDYTHEAGLRELERQLAGVFRKVARRVVEGRQTTVTITDKSLPRYLGPKRFFVEVAERVDQPGVAIGLAWTAAGGDILFIEATRMPGKAELKLTGSLGAVMKESVEAAMSWLRTHGAALRIPADTFEAAFHLHVPAGAIPKDGPSAGVTMVTALASLVLGRAVRPQMAMTGEITLRGKVLPVGGIKEKVLAARRAGITEVVLPRHNENDLTDIPKELRRDLKFTFVDTIDEVLDVALVPPEPAPGRV